jgi:hypothetical protein
VVHERVDVETSVAGESGRGFPVQVNQIVTEEKRIRPAEGERSGGV